MPPPPSKRLKIGRPKGTKKKVKRGRPPLKNLKKQPEPISSGSEPISAPSTKIGYHMHALQFECGICASIIPRDRVGAHNQGFHSYVPKRQTYFKVYSNNTKSVLPKILEDFYGQPYPTSDLFNPNICKSCYNAVKERKIPNKLTKSWSNSTSSTRKQSEHFNDIEYNININCSTCVKTQGRTPHAFFTSENNPKCVDLNNNNKVKKVILCGKSIRHNRNTTCLQSKGHSGNCTVTENIKSAKERIGGDAKFREQVVASLLKDVKESQGNSTSLTLSQAHGPQVQVHEKQNTRSRRRSERPEPGFDKFVEIARDRFLALNKQDENLALYREIDGNSNKIDACTKSFHERLNARVEDIHKSEFHWIGVGKLSAQEKNNRSLQRYLKDNCDTCLKVNKYTTVEELTHTNNANQECVLIPGTHYRKLRTTTECEVQKLYAFGGTNALELVERVLDHREVQIGEIKRENVECRIGCDFGQGLTKLVLSIVIDEFKELASSDSHKNTFLLATTKVGETVPSLQALWDISGAEALWDKYQVRFCGDLKVSNLLFNLNKCSCKQPCVLCFWKSVLDAKERKNGESLYDKGDLRGKYAQWEEFVEQVENGALVFDSGSVKGLPVSKRLTDNAKGSIVPPPLHIRLGIVNTCFRKGKNGVLKKAPRTLVDAWYNEAKVNVTDYFGGDLEGRECTMLIENCETLKDWNTDFYEMVKKFAEVNREVLGKKDNLCQDDFENMHKLIDDFILLFEKNEMNYTTKVHWLHRHVMPFTEYTYRTCGFYGEQFVESIHKYYVDQSKNFNRFKDVGEQRAMECWNRLRFNAPTQPKTRKRKD